MKNNDNVNLQLEYLTCQEEITDLIKRIELKIDPDKKITWPILGSTKAAKHHLLLALHCLGGLTEQEERNNKI